MQFESAFCIDRFFRFCYVLRMKTYLRKILRPNTSFFLFGPRGTGKSTWLKQAFPDAYLINLLDGDRRLELLSRPEALAEIVHGVDPGRPVVVDEIQKNPALLDTVHSLMEEDQSRQFVLTGSSARKLRRAGVDLLAGRAIQINCHPFTAEELGEDFNLDSALQEGLVPLVYSSGANKAKVLRGYIDLYIREEVEMEGLIRNLSSFTRFLEAVSFSHASVLSSADVARECAVNRMTVNGYLSILEDLYLAYRLPVFTRRAKRALIAHDKFYFFDAGVFRALRPIGPMDDPRSIEGAALEGLVLQHLRAWNDYTEANCQLGFWRTRSGVEVDCVLYGPKRFFAIEVKHANRVRPEDLTGLKAFSADYPQAQPLFVYCGRDRRIVEGITCYPAAEFLLHLTDILSRTNAFP